jgi:hypothetical protein
MGAAFAGPVELPRALRSNAETPVVMVQLRRNRSRAGTRLRDYGEERCCEGREENAMCD